MSTGETEPLFPGPVVTSGRNGEVEPQHTAEDQMLTRRRARCVSLAASLLLAATATAQQERPAVRGTASLGLAGQQTTVLGSFWPGVAASGGFTVRLAPRLALRTEAEAAGFISGGSAEADCIAGARCLSQKTPGGIGGGSALILIRHDAFPLFAGVGLGAWRASDGDDRLHGGPTYVAGLTISGRRGIAIEGRFNCPTTAMGIVTSTMSAGLRFSP